MDSHATTGRSLPESAVPQAGPHGRSTSQRRQRAGLAALAALAVLAMAGCGGGSASQAGHSAPVPSEGSSGGQAAAGGAAEAAGPAVAAEASGTGGRSGVTGSALFGGNQNLVPEEASLGRRLAIVRVYYQLGESFPSPEDRQLMAAGSTLLVSLDTVPGDAGYASIAAGRQDATISAFLKALNQAAIRYHLAAIYFCFEHEVNALGHHQGLGTPQQFIQAWDHIHQLAESARLDWNQGGRIHWVWILTHEAFVQLAARPRWALGMGSPGTYWPGTGEVDIVAADGYDNYGCTVTGQGNGATPAALFDGLIRFAKAHGGLPVFIAEWASTAFPTSQRQTVFIKQMQAFVTANREVAAVLYWNSAGVGPHCDFSIDSQPASIAALAAMGRSPLLQGRPASS